MQQQDVSVADAAVAMIRNRRRAGTAKTARCAVVLAIATSGLPGGVDCFSPSLTAACQIVRLRTNRRDGVFGGAGHGGAGQIRPDAGAVNRPGGVGLVGNARCRGEVLPPRWFEGGVKSVAVLCLGAHLQRELSMALREGVEQEHAAYLGHRKQLQPLPRLRRVRSMPPPPAFSSLSSAQAAQEGQQWLKREGVGGRRRILAFIFVCFICVSQWMLPHLLRLSGASARRPLGGASMMVDAEMAKLCFGMVAGSVSAVLLLPIDQVKTAMQVKGGGGSRDGEDKEDVAVEDRQGDGIDAPAYLRRVVDEQGVQGLFKGLKPAVTGGAPEAGIQFAVHDWSLAAFSAILAANTVNVGIDSSIAHTVALSAGEVVGSSSAPATQIIMGLIDSPASVDTASAQLIASAVKESPVDAMLLSSMALPAVRPPPSMLLNGAAGALSGLCQVVATCPMEVMKQKEMLGEKSDKIALGDLFRGAGATWLRDIPFSSLYFAFAAYFHHALSSSAGLGDAAATALSGLLAGTMSSFVTTPADVIKTKIQCEEDDDGASISEVAARIWREDGAMGFFAGVGARVGKIGPAMCINVAVYETLKVLTLQF